MGHPLRFGEGWAAHRLLIVQSHGGGEIWAAAELWGLKALGRRGKVETETCKRPKPFF